MCLICVEGWILVSLHTLSHQGGMDNMPMHAAHTKAKQMFKTMVSFQAHSPQGEVSPQIGLLSKAPFLPMCQQND